MSEEHDSKIEDIKRRLYEREDTVKNRRHEGVLHTISHNVDPNWKEDSEKNINLEKIKMRKPHTSIFKKFFIISIIFFVVAISFAIYKFYNGDISVVNEKIDITVIGNAFTKGGEELPLQIEITNRNNASLELANLIIEYPKGAEDNVTEIVRLPHDVIGTIKPGESVVRNAKVTLFGIEKSIRNVKIILEYHSEGSNAIVYKEKEYSVTIDTAPISLMIEAPETLSSDQSVSLKITASLNTSIPKEATIVQVSYPSNFIFEESTPLPSIGNATWDISSITTTEPISIEIKGRLTGQDGDQQIFHIYTGAKNPNNPSLVDVVYNSSFHNILIVKPFLEIHILVSGQKESSYYTASAGETIQVQIPWANNLSNRIMNAEIIAKLSGNVFDKNLVKTSDGFYDSSNNQIIWSENTNSSLASIEPGERGTVEFDLEPLSLIGSSGVIKEPQLLVEVSIRGRQPNYSSTYSDVNSFVKKIIKIVSDFQITSSANYFSGFLPPKAEGETRYKITWTLSNSINNVNQAKARSSLPIYVNWVGIVPGMNEKISYNEITREVTWDIGSVPPTNGIDSNREVSFFISLKPSLSQIGSVPELMKEIYLTGQDSYTNTLIKSSRRPITTLLLNDPIFRYGYEKVVK